LFRLALASRRCIFLPLYLCDFFPTANRASQSPDLTANLHASKRIDFVLRLDSFHSPMMQFIWTGEAALLSNTSVFAVPRVKEAFALGSSADSPIHPSPKCLEGVVYEVALTIFTASSAPGTGDRCSIRMWDVRFCFARGPERGLRRGHEM
jgi:hypothetical protein